MITARQGVHSGGIPGTGIDMEERLQKVIAAAGITSRRKAEDLIREGRVSVNGTVVQELGTKVTPQDIVEVDGRKLIQEEKVYYLLNKPKHVLCTLHDDRGRETVLDYVRVKERVFPVGRLDYDTTGVLLLTNDGDFADRMMHPGSHLPKQYEASINGILNEEQLQNLRNGIDLEDGRTLPAEAEIVSVNQAKQKSVLHITIFEGRNREVRRMIEYFGYQVIRLERLKYGHLDAGKLHRGEYRRLKPYEVEALLQSSRRRAISSASGSM